MKYSRKVKDRAVQGLKKLISDGHTREAEVSAIAELTGTPESALKSWLLLDEAHKKGYLAPPKKVDKLAGYRDKRWDKGERRHPDDIALEEIQGEYLKLNYDF